MLDVRVATDCGNAPKRQFILDFTIALARNDVQALTEAVSEDILWCRVGGTVHQGREAFLAGLLAARPEVAVLTVHNVLTHGSAGSINGIFEDSQGRVVEFCDVHEFTSHGKTALLKNITSYWLPAGA